jgi:competence protein ComEC
MSIIWRSARSGSSGSSAGWWRDIGLTVLLAGFWFVAGIVAAMVQLAQMPKVWQGDGTGLSVSGTVEQVDGRSNARLRLWVRVDKTPVAGSAPRPAAVAGYLARLSLDAPEAVMTTPEGIRNVLPGDRLQLAVRIYPSPPAVFYGAQDHARQARARDVVASGYLTRPPQYLGTGDGWPHRLARYRQARADTIAEGMSAPQGGIAAALLIGDRRHVDDSTYDMFRFSGLAHLLAISGLHMGLLCFGVIGFLRGVMALMPCVNSLLSLAFRCVTAWVVCSSSSLR